MKYAILFASTAILVQALPQEAAPVFKLAEYLKEVSQEKPFWHATRNPGEAPEEAPEEKPFWHATPASVEAPKEATEGPVEAPEELPFCNAYFSGHTPGKNCRMRPEVTQSPVEAPKNVTQRPIDAPKEVTQGPAEAPDELPFCNAYFSGHTPGKNCRMWPKATQSPAEPPKNVTQSPVEAPKNITQSPVEAPKKLPKTTAHVSSSNETTVRLPSAQVTTTQLPIIEATPTRNMFTNGSSVQQTKTISTSAAASLSAASSASSAAATGVPVSRPKVDYLLQLSQKFQFEIRGGLFNIIGMPPEAAVVSWRLVQELSVDVSIQERFYFEICEAGDRGHVFTKIQGQYIRGYTDVKTSDVALASDSVSVTTRFVVHNNGLDYCFIENNKIVEVKHVEEKKVVAKFGVAAVQCSNVDACQPQSNCQGDKCSFNLVGKSENGTVPSVYSFEACQPEAECNRVMTCSGNDCIVQKPAQGPASGPVPAEQVRTVTIAVIKAAAEGHVSQNDQAVGKQGTNVNGGQAGAEQKQTKQQGHAPDGTKHTPSDQAGCIPRPKAAGASAVPKAANASALPKAADASAFPKEQGYAPYSLSYEEKTSSPSVPLPQGQQMSAPDVPSQEGSRAPVVHAAGEMMAADAAPSAPAGRIQLPAAGSSAFNTSEPTALGSSAFAAGAGRAAAVFPLVAPVLAVALFL